MVDFRLSTFLNDIECSIAKYLSILIAAIVKTLAPTETPINKIKSHSLNEDLKDAKKTKKSLQTYIILSF